MKVYGRTDYNCVIVGDGTSHHWGVDFREFDPATIKISCTEPSEAKTSSLTVESE